MFEGRKQWLGPLFFRELRELASKRRTYALRILYGLILLYAAYLSLEIAPKLLGNTPGIKAMAAVGADLFTRVALAQVLVVNIAVPLLVCDAISSERRQQTLDILRVTHPTSIEIVCGKLSSRVLVALTLTLCSLPILTLFSWFGGIEPLHVLLLEVYTFATILFLGAAGLVFSARYTSLWKSLVLTYLSALFFSLHIAILLGLSTAFIWLILDLPIHAFRISAGLLIVVGACMVAAPYVMRLILQAADALEREPEQSILRELPATMESSGVTILLPPANGDWSIGPLLKAQLRREWRAAFATDQAMAGRMVVLFPVVMWSLLVIGAEAFTSLPEAIAGIWALLFFITTAVSTSNPLLNERPGHLDLLLMCCLTGRELLLVIIYSHCRWLLAGIGIGSMVLLPFLYWVPESTLWVGGIGVAFTLLVYSLGTWCALAEFDRAKRHWLLITTMAIVLFLPGFVPSKMATHYPRTTWLLLLGLIAIFVWRPKRISPTWILWRSLAIYLALVVGFVVLPADLGWTNVSALFASSDWQAHQGNHWLLFSPYFWLSTGCAGSSHAGGDGYDLSFVGYLLALVLTLGEVWRWGIDYFDTIVGRTLSKCERSAMPHEHFGVTVSPSSKRGAM